MLRRGRENAVTVDSMPDGERVVVFVDADDTLWENNRWFTRVIDNWVVFVAGLGAEGDAALLTLHEEEDLNIPLHGYGARPFCHSLRTAFARLVPDPDEPVRTANFPVEIVSETSSTARISSLLLPR